MQFDTKIAIVIRSDLEAWQKLNVAAFLASGIAAAHPNCIGAPYEDASGSQFHALIGQPILIYGGDRAALSRALERAASRDVKAAVYTEDMFKTKPIVPRLKPSRAPISIWSALPSAPSAKSSTRSSTG